MIESMWIDNEEMKTERIESHFNPSNIKEKIGELSLGNEEHVDLAVKSAEKSWPEWRKTTPNERARLMETMADYIEENVDELAGMLTKEHGKIYKECRFEVLAGANILRYYASLKDHLIKDETIENEQGKLVLTRQPVGVVSVIVPWNGPIILGLLMIAPSLIAGNTLIVKPAMNCPFTLIKILKNMAQFLPDGVINVVVGTGSTIGNAMVMHPKVRKVAFTGSTEVGRTIMANASSTIKKLSMELGGNDAAIVLDDAILDEKTINEMVRGTFTMGGQICYGIKRIYVPKEKYDEFVEKFIQRADKILVGPGSNPKATMGPINNKAQYVKVKSLIEKAKQDGANVTVVGGLVEGVSLSDGYYILPTIISDVDNKSEIVQDEQFGPVIPIIAYDSLEEVIDYTNDTEFGLGNSLWTSNEDKAFQLAKCLQSGSVFINIHRMGASAANMPFGGFKQSGVGRGHGVEGLLEHTELQAIIRRDDM